MSYIQARIQMTLQSYTQLKKNSPNVQSTHCRVTVQRTMRPADIECFCTYHTSRVPVQTHTDHRPTATMVKLATYAFHQYHIANQNSTERRSTYGAVYRFSQTRHDLANSNHRQTQH